MSDRPQLTSMASSRSAIEDLSSSIKYAGDSKAKSPLLKRHASIDEGPLKDYVLPYTLDKASMASVIDSVRKILLEQNFLAKDVIEAEMDQFFDHLGLDAWFFSEQTAQELSNYIVSLATAKMISKISGTKLNITLNDNKSGRAMFMVPSDPGNRLSAAVQLEYNIETRFLGEGYKRVDTQERKFFRLQCYRTTGTVKGHNETKLRLYLLETPEYPEDAVHDPSFEITSIDDLKRVSDESFFAVATHRTKLIICEMLNEARVFRAGGTVIRGFHYPDSQEFRLMVCYRQASTHSFLSGLTDLYHSYGMSSTRKYVEQFAHGFTVYSIYLDVADRAPETLPKLFEDIQDDASFLYVLPRTSLSSLIKEQGLSQQEHVYAYSAWKFAYHFLSRYTHEYQELAASVTHSTSERSLSQTQALTALGKLKLKLAKDSFTEQRLRDTILAHPEIVKALYADFERLHSFTEDSTDASNRHRPSNNDAYKSEGRQGLLALIRKSVTTPLDGQIFEMFIKFNQHVLKTNFYRRDKVAVSFRLDPAYLELMDYPLTPFGVFFVVGSEFRGFHVRFKDVARGGIRVVRSRSLAAFQGNLPTLFDEVYNLAATQQRKNKDIPEGGSKGVILLSPDHQDKAEVAFQKYVDALLDLLLVSKETVDYYAKEELLFLGPDEGTADYMNWASQHARVRGASFWKAFTTGKSRSSGGIPHDLYGMTTRSIHTYVLGCLGKLGLDEREVTKFQTGGPDGDLGSNEVLVSLDRTVGIVDGGGVLYDPQGIDRDELKRLAKARQMTRHFDRSKLSKDGFYVDVEHQDLSEPSDLSSPNLPAELLALYAAGVGVRNGFHVSPFARAKLFVPCGGRPRAVDLSNVNLLLPDNKPPMFDIIVEGANLFFTQEARMELEKAGVVLYKDASANKGGVTSSSLEVFAALSLDDDQFVKLMCVADDNNVPEFYDSYVKDVLRIIEDNAQAEFECLWREAERTGRPRCELSDAVSVKINELNDAISTSTLWAQDNVKYNVLAQACPPTLMKLLGLKTILERVPESYTKAIFCSRLASRFVYQFGLNPAEFAFFEFVQPLLKDVDPSVLSPAK